MPTDEREIWFPAKRYGWGWGLPGAWQGWVVLAAYLVMVVAGAVYIDPDEQPLLFTGWLLGFSALLGAVCWLKGERPRWRWGVRR